MAVITVSPTTDLSALMASDNVSRGDVLVPEDGRYFQVANVAKSVCGWLQKALRW
ncbi:MAG TPA: hypothetical protein GXX34_00500 [Clostridia bacterium]|nr:hypothetical protein [Clostridia bacterium]